MTADSSMHVFWVQPMPGVADNARVIVAADNEDKTSLVVVLPDNTQVIITADRAVYIRADHMMLTLNQWQFAPVSPDEYYQDTAPMQIPEVPADYQDQDQVAPRNRRGGTFTLGGRRTFA